MNRRTAFFCLLAVAKTSLVSSVVMASEQAARIITRIAGPRWNVNGDWTPDLDSIQSHLRTAHGIDPTGLSLDQLIIVHDNDHNRMGYRPGHGGKESPKGSTKGYRKS
jgi:hypothetical protein